MLIYFGNIEKLTWRSKEGHLKEKQKEGRGQSQDIRA